MLADQRLKLAIWLAQLNVTFVEIAVGSLEVAHLVEE